MASRIGKEQEPNLKQPVIPPSDGYRWTWPPHTIDITHLSASRGLVNVFLTDDQEGSTVTSILSGTPGQIDIHTLTRTYQTLDTIREARPDELTDADRALFGSLRDALYSWFLDSAWVVQPPINPSGPPSHDREDNRFHRLLLPARMMNTLTKLVLNTSIEDVERDALIQLADETHADAANYLARDYINRVAMEVAQLRRSSGTIRGHDLEAWVAAEGQEANTLHIKAHAILDESYRRTRGYFHPRNVAAGLYFMKSVIIGVMQEWHQQRQGITDMVPPITWQDSDEGHSHYDFRSNTTLWGDMHTNDGRFPFQKYVAHYMQAST